MHPIECAADPTPPRPQWLVSVRSLSEAKLATQFSVDILDWKEPSRGALEPVSTRTWEAAARCEALSGIPLSAALGESESALKLCRQLPGAFRFAKAGPSQTTLRSLEQLWGELRRELAPSVELVAVAYADHETANCPDAESVFRLAADCGLKRILIDTFSKDGISSFIRIGDQLSTLRRLAASHSLWWSLAGSITLAEIRRLPTEVFPNCFAVRGDVCEQARTSGLSSKRMRRWQLWIEETRSQKTAISGSEHPQTQSSPVNF